MKRWEWQMVEEPLSNTGVLEGYLRQDFEPFAVASGPAGKTLLLKKRVLVDRDERTGEVTAA